MIIRTLASTAMLAGLLAAAQASADQAAVAADSPAYASATAHDPHFGDKAVWPWLTGKEAYAKQEWPKARVLVWSGGDGKFEDASRWLEDGRPAKAPPDRETDCVLPAADSRYTVKGKTDCRHLTIGRNAKLHVPIRSLKVWGNLWAKRGGGFVRIVPVGDRNTFFRKDVAGGYELPKHSGLGNRAAFPHNIHSKMPVAKYRGASVEFLGHMGVDDELYVVAGKMVIGPDSEFRFNGATGNGTFEVFDGATLELQDGAVLANHMKSKHIYNVTLWPGARLQAGSPERPITRDVHIRTQPWPEREVHGLYCAKGASMRVYSADPEKARLVLESRLPGVDLKSAGGIGLDLAGDVKLDGVLFDQVGPRGIRLTDPAMRKQWQNVFFGEHCGGKPDGLFGKVSAGTHKYRRKAHKFRLYIRPSLQDMEEFEEEAD